MKPEIKQRWIQALRSGHYSQTQKNLRTENGYCCLGVLCDLYAQDHSDAVWVDNGIHNDGIKVYSFMTTVSHALQLPEQVMAWSGLSDYNPTVIIHNTEYAIAGVNDGGTTFDEIADLIEAQF